MVDGEAMRFFVDETSFELPAGIAVDTLERHIETFIQLVGARHKQGEDVLRWSKLFEETEVQPGTRLFELLYTSLEQLPIDRDTRLGLQQALNRCVLWDDRIEPVMESHIEIDGVSSIAPTIAVVHAQISARSGAACLALGARSERTGIQAVRAGEATHDIHFVTHEPGAPRVLPHALRDRGSQP